MAAASVVYERAIDRPPCAETRARIAELIEARRDDVPFAFDYRWDKAGRSLSIHNSLATWQVSFAQRRVVVTARLSLMARMFNTPANRAKLTSFFDDVVEELEA